MYNNLPTNKTIIICFNYIHWFMQNIFRIIYSRNCALQSIFIYIPDTSCQHREKNANLRITMNKCAWDIPRTAKKKARRTFQNRFEIFK